MHLEKLVNSEWVNGVFDDDYWVLLILLILIKEVEFVVEVLANGAERVLNV